MAVAVGEVLADDERIRGAVTDVGERLRPIVRRVHHVAVGGENGRKRSARPLVRAGNQQVDGPGRRSPCGHYSPLTNESVTVALNES